MKFYENLKKENRMNTWNEHIRIADIVAKKRLAGEALPPDEERLLADWLQASERNRQLYARVMSGESALDFDAVVAMTDEREQWRRLNRLLGTRRTTLWRWASVAALLAVGCACWWLLGREQHAAETPLAVIPPGTNRAVLILDNGSQIPLEAQDTLMHTAASDIRIKAGQVEYRTEPATPAAEERVSYNTIVVPRGGVYALVLADGSKVFLNSESELTYPVRFAGGERRVLLKGEAFFEVSHCAEKPFVVESGELHTKVLGTVFNVKAYEDEPEMQTTLLEGCVEVSVKNTANREILQPGKQACWLAESGKFTVRETDVRCKALWRDGIMIWNEEPLESILRMLCRWYDVTYECCQPLGDSHTFTGKINRNENLQSVLQVLTLLGGPHFRLEDRVIHVSN